MPQQHVEPVFAAGTQITFDQKSVIELEYRRLLIDDLLHSRTEFSAGPYEAHIQFSNYCNMSCIMCWDGNNPPTKRTSPELLERIGEQLGKHLSIITPYSGSEPLVLTWDEARDMSQHYGILLCITTNVQFLDEKRFHELKDITETLILSIDSHVPEVFEKIRPRSNSRKVFKNLESTARLAKVHNLECIVNVVFMTQNAPMLTETIEYLADLGIENINLIQLLDVNGTSSFNDPLLHYSEDYVAWIKRSCISMAKSKKIRLIWSIAGYHEYDFREPSFVPPNPRKNWNDDWDFKMKLMFPGFCRNAYGRLRVDSEGDVAPCCYATQGELSLGNLNETDFDSIWNGSSAQDLRRGMYTGDVPALCKSCRYHDPIPSLPTLDFVEQCENNEANVLSTSNNAALADVDPILPDHATRHEQKPNLRIRMPLREIADYYVALSIGGQADDIVFSPVSTVAAAQTNGSESNGPESNAAAANIVELELPEAIWSELKSNVGYWWMVWGVPKNPDQNTIHLTSTRCFIKHQSLPRIEGSQLRYHDQGFVPITDLGGSKKVGWTDQNQIPERPTVTTDRQDKNIAKTSLTNATKEPGEQSKSDSNQLDSLYGPRTGNVLSRMIGKVLGSRVEARPIILDGYIECFERVQDALQIRGWLLLQDGAADSIEIVSHQDYSQTVSQVERSDLVTAFPGVARADQAGYQIELPDDQYWVTNHYEFHIVARRGSKEVFRCFVTLPAIGESETFPDGPHATRDRIVTIEK